MNFIRNESAQKLRGGYYTPPDIASFLARWVLEGNPRRLLEPSCGDGVFFDAVAKLKPTSLEAFVACEILEEEAAKARRRGRAMKNVRVTVHNTDFLRWHLEHILEPGLFDGVLGNPPFIRYQYLDSTLQERAEQIFSAYHLPFTKHTNSWVSFVITSVAQLRPGGRLAMVVPSELLHILHAQSLRKFLLDQCSRIVVIDPQELWFDDLLQGVVLLLAEKAPRPQTGGKIAIFPVKSRGFLAEHPSSFFQRADFISGSKLPRKWMPALLSSKERALFEGVSQRSAIHEFGSIADVDVGIVTGANKFFLVPDSVVDAYELGRWAHPMFGRSEHVRGVIFDQRAYDENRRLGLPSSFLWFGETDIQKFPASVRRYLREGEAQGLHHRYKCRIRTPWYNVPSVFPASVGMLKRSNNFPRLTLNRLRVLSTDTAYRVKPIRIAADRLVYCFVNSLTALSAELEGRHYGGGVLELVPSEIERVLIPVASVPSGGLARLDKLIRDGAAPERVLASQDKHILRSLSLSNQDCQDLLAAWKRLRNRRHRNGHDVAEAVQEGDSRDLEYVRGAVLSGTIDR